MRFWFDQKKEGSELRHPCGIDLQRQAAKLAKVSLPTLEEVILPPSQAILVPHSLHLASAHGMVSGSNGPDTGHRSQTGHLPGPDTVGVSSQEAPKCPLTTPPGGPGI